MQIAIIGTGFAVHAVHRHFNPSAEVGGGSQSDLQSDAGQVLGDQTNTRVGVDDQDPSTRIVPAAPLTEEERQQILDVVSQVPPYNNGTIKD
nr:hypothetical protein [Candidatus Woesebacteria bacterium]